jgi:hypothetical protein
LTATYAQPKFNEAAKKNGFKVYSEPRGAPENVGEVLEAVHPVVSNYSSYYHPIWAILFEKELTA